MATTAQTMVSDFRLFVQDSDTTVSKDFEDSQCRTFLNYALLWMYENYEKRVKKISSPNVVDVSSETTEYAAATTFLYPEIIALYYDATGLVSEVPIPRLPWSEIKMRQNRGDGISGTPDFYAAIRMGAGAVSAGAQNLWRFAFYPSPSSGTYTIIALVRDYPVQLTADADIVDLGDFEARLCVLIAVVLAANLKGAPELAANAMQLLPKMIQDKLATHQVPDEAIAT